jgi:hypothetical protein
LRGRAALQQIIEQLQVAQHHGRDVVEVVRNTAGELLAPPSSGPAKRSSPAGAQTTDTRWAIASKH